MPNNMTPEGWRPTPFDPNQYRTGKYAQYFVPSPLPQMNTGNRGGGLPYNPGGGGGGVVEPPIGGRPYDPSIGLMRPHSGPDLGSTNVTMPGMFSPTGVGMPDLLPKSPRAILWDKLYGTMGY